MCTVGCLVKSKNLFTFSTITFFKLEVTQHLSQVPVQVLMKYKLQKKVDILKEEMATQQLAFPSLLEICWSVLPYGHLQLNGMPWDKFF